MVKTKKRQKSKLKVGNKIKIIKGANKGVVGVITSMEKDFTDITIKTDSGHRLHGLSLAHIKALPKKAISRSSKKTAKILFLAHGWTILYKGKLITNKLLTPLEVVEEANRKKLHITNKNQMIKKYSDKFMY